MILKAGLLTEEFLCDLFDIDVKDLHKDALSINEGENYIVLFKDEASSRHDIVSFRIWRRILGAADQASGYWKVTQILNLSTGTIYKL